MVRLPEDQLGALFAGPPAFVLVAPPGGNSTAALGDGKLREPGRYLMLCFVPTGADPAAFIRRELITSGESFEERQLDFGIAPVEGRSSRLQ